MVKVITYKPYGDKGILIELGKEISEEINNRVVIFSQIIEKENHSHITDVIPSYNSILVIYNPLEKSYDDLINNIKSLEKKISKIEKINYKVIHIPVIYGGEYGEDLEIVANHNKLSKEDVVKIHSETYYRVYMLGFTPGFPYLGGMSEKISTPRKKTPRKQIKKGSVGIGGNQTGIYSTNSPGGWQIIGRSPLEFFDVKKSKPLLKPGDLIKFEPIDEKEYKRIKNMIEEEKFQVKTSLLEETSRWVIY